MIYQEASFIVSIENRFSQARGVDRVRKGNFGFIAGFIAGAMIFGSTAAFAAGIAANTAASRVFVNGSEVKAEAYNIHGNNFFMLRDIAAAVDFSVVWDGANNKVLIDTSRGYDPSETMAPPAPADAQNPAMSIGEMKAEIIRLTNAERVKAGVPELEILPELTACAQAKVEDFMDNGYFGHTSPKYGTAGEMIKSFVPNAKSASENLGGWALTPGEAFAGWTGSSEHKRIMLDPKYTHIGVGIAEGIGGGYWWVQQLVAL